RELDRRRTQRLDDPVQEAARNLLVALHLVSRQLQPAGHLHEDLAVDQLRAEAFGDHAADSLSTCAICSADVDAWHTAHPALLFQGVAERLRAGRVPQLAQAPGLDLPNPLAGDAEALTDLFERPLMSIDQPESELKDAALAGRKRVQDVLDLVVQHRQRRRVR